jgi:hypothetical protein
MSSAIASTVKMATAAVEPINASRVPARLSQFRCAAQAVTAGAVRERIPDTIPIANARNRTKEALMERKMYLCWRRVSRSKRKEQMETVRWRNSTL